MSDAANARSVTELRVTANLMTLEAGSYCVFVSPEGSAGEAGLPAVRVSAGPGVGAGRVAIAGFGDAGWLAGPADAALVRVVDGPAAVLVTVYRGEEAGEAPKVQVLRLSGAAEAVVPAGPAGPIEAMAHVYGRGDVGGRLGEWIGERGSRRWIEGFALQAMRLAGVGTMEYQAVLGRGWLSPWVEAGQFCGSRGMSLPILGMHVRLVGAAAAQFEVSVSASFVDGTSVEHVRGGPVEAPGLAALEAFEVVLTEKAAPKAAPKGAGKRRR